MGFLDALTADQYPRDSQGRRIFAPYGRRGKAYILPPERAAQYARLQRRFFLAFFVVLVIAVVAFGPWAVLAVGLLWIAWVFVGIAHVTRGLEESTERPSLSSEQRRDRRFRAMGRPTMYAFFLGGTAVAVVGAVLLLRGERGVSVWFITLYGALVAILYARQLRKNRGVPPA